MVSASFRWTSGSVEIFPPTWSPAHTPVHPPSQLASLPFPDSCRNKRGPNRGSETSPNVNPYRSLWILCHPFPRPTHKPKRKRRRNHSGNHCFHKTLFSHIVLKQRQPCHKVQHTAKRAKKYRKPGHTNDQKERTIENLPGAFGHLRAPPDD